jgi:hypothetical protein
MTWVFLSDKARTKISLDAGPYVADSYVPHEAEVRKLNPRANWHGLTKEERQATIDGMAKPFYMHNLFASLEAKLKEKNFD